MVMQESLLRKPGEECRDELEGLLEALDMVGAMQMEEVYIQGMRMGAKLMMELTGKESLPKTGA